MKVSKIFLETIWYFSSVMSWYMKHVSIDCLVWLYFLKSMQVLSSYKKSSISSVIFQDPSSLVRRSFLEKIHKLLRERSIPSRYACAFALAASDCIGDVCLFPTYLSCCLVFFYCVSLAVRSCHSVLFSCFLLFVNLVDKIPSWVYQGLQSRGSNLPESWSAGSRKNNDKLSWVCCGILDSCSCSPSRLSFWKSGRRFLC